MKNNILGTRKATPVIRFVWTNGTFQNEITAPLSSVLQFEQRLSGSCPFLFSWDGEKMVFVADFLWSAPLGMYINGQNKGGTTQTTDWVKVRYDNAGEASARGWTAARAGVLRSNVRAAIGGLQDAVKKYDGALKRWLLD